MHLVASHYSVCSGDYVKQPMGPRAVVFLRPWSKTVGLAVMTCCLFQRRGGVSYNSADQAVLYLHLLGKCRSTPSHLRRRRRGKHTQAPGFVPSCVKIFLQWLAHKGKGYLHLTTIVQQHTHLHTYTDMVNYYVENHFIGIEDKHEHE